MEQEKISTSDTSTAESNPPENGAAAAAAAAATRSYDCSFCKRGFTNAQALGGHMNIHRKDKAKAKKSKNRGGDEDPMIRSFGSSFFPQAHAPPPNPRGNYEYCFFPVWRPENLQDRIDGSLSSRLDEDDDDDDDDDEEVDLELRLGRLF